jgi:hypothetical protein
VRRGSLVAVRVAVSIALALAFATPVRAQGKGKGPHGHPPSSSSLPSPTIVAPATIGAVPFAWIDDASMLPPGTVAGSLLVVGWQGTDLSEVDAPVVGLAAGLTPRLQLGASVPHVVGSDVSGVVGGLGTTYLSAKIGVLTGGASGVKLAVAPTIEILGAGALQSLAPGTGRTQFGLPMSLEVDHGPARAFASTGFFSQGVWFAGGGVGAQVTPRVAVSAAFSRAWATDPINGAAGDRREISGSVAFSPRPGLSLFGSLGRTLATSELDGAGTTVTGGVMFVLSSSTWR